VIVVSGSRDSVAGDELPPRPGSDGATDDVLATAQAGPTAVRGGALRVGAYAVASLVALGSGALLYRHLGVHETGRYTIAGSLVALVAVATDLGLTGIGLREFSIRRGADRARIAGQLLGLRLGVTVVGVLLASLFAGLVYGGSLGVGVALAGTGLVFAVWQNVLALPLVVGLRLGWVALLELAMQILVSIWVVAFVLADARLLWFLAAGIPASLLVLGATRALVGGQLHVRPRLAPRQWRKLLAPIASFSLAAAAAAVYFRLAILLVSLLTSGHETGYFSLSFNIMAALLTIPGILVSAGFPIFSRAAHEDHARLAYGIERVFEVSLILGAWISLAIVLGARFAVELIGGPKFAPAAGILAIQGISVGATFVGTVWGFAMLSLARYRATMIFNLSALAMLAASVTVLASIDGAHGAAIATSGVEVADAIIAFYILTYRRPHLRPSLRAVPKVALALAVAATPALLPIGEPARVACSAVLYVIVLMALRAVPSEVLALLPTRRLARPG
jgi:O-antigen/teichoic acid export membrane protein